MKIILNMKNIQIINIKFAFKYVMTRKPKVNDRHLGMGIHKVPETHSKP